MIDLRQNHYGPPRDLPRFNLPNMVHHLSGCDEYVKKATVAPHRYVRQALLSPAISLVRVSRRAHARRHWASTSRLLVPDTIHGLFHNSGNFSSSLTVLFAIA